MAMDQYGDTIKEASVALAGAMSDEVEPMLLLDTTGSMHRPNSEGSTASRIDVVREALGTVVEKLGAEDSQAGKPGDEGGLRTITFAGGTAVDIEDLNPGNLHEKWAHIRFEGTTEIMPGMATLLSAYKDEFGDRQMNERPRLRALIITDGEADDTTEFAAMCKQIGGNMFIEIALLGYGVEHDAAQQAYQQVAAINKHVKVVSFGNETDPQAIATGLLEMLG